MSLKDLRLPNILGPIVAAVTFTLFSLPAEMHESILPSMVAIAVSLVFRVIFKHSKDILAWIYFLLPIITAMATIFGWSLYAIGALVIIGFVASPFIAQKVNSSPWNVRLLLLLDFGVACLCFWLSLKVLDIL